MTNTKINWGLVVKSFVVYLVFNLLLIDSIGLIVGAVAFALLDKSKSKKDLWAYALLIGLYEGLNSAYKTLSVISPSTRDISVELVNFVFITLIAFIVTKVISWIVGKFRS